jgi:hypothetical protein
MSSNDDRIETIRQYLKDLSLPFIMIVKTNPKKANFCYYGTQDELAIMVLAAVNNDKQLFDILDTGLIVAREDDAAGNQPETIPTDPRLN